MADNEGLLMPGEAFPFGWNESLLAPLLPHCKLFVGPGAGVETIDVPYLTRKWATLRVALTVAAL